MIGTEVLNEYTLARQALCQERGIQDRLSDAAALKIPIVEQEGQHR